MRLLRLEKVQGVLIYVYKYLTERVRKRQILPRYNQWQEVNETQQEISLKIFFTVRVVPQWSRLYRVAVKSASLEVFQAQLDTVLNNAALLTLLWAKIWKMFSRVLPQPVYSFVFKQRIYATLKPLFHNIIFTLHLFLHDSLTLNLSAWQMIL